MDSSAIHKYQDELIEHIETFKNVKKKGEISEHFSKIFNNIRDTNIFETLAFSVLDKREGKIILLECPLLQDNLITEHQLNYFPDFSYNKNNKLPFADILFLMDREDREFENYTPEYIDPLYYSNKSEDSYGKCNGSKKPYHYITTIEITEYILRFLRDLHFWKSDQFEIYIKKLNNETEKHKSNDPEIKIKLEEQKAGFIKLLEYYRKIGDLEFSHITEFFKFDQLDISNIFNAEFEKVKSEKDEYDENKDFISAFNMLSPVPIFSFLFLYSNGKYHEQLIFPIWFSPLNYYLIFKKAFINPSIFILSTFDPRIKSATEDNSLKIKERYYNIKDYASTLIIPLVDEYYERIVRHEMLMPLRKSAISSVMLRNLSHNFGSHSLVYLGKKDHLNKSTFDKSPQFQLSTGLEDKIQCSNRYDFAELLALYNNNLRVRMDLIADIVTSVPVSENPRWLFKDVLKKFADNRILADTISGAENFTYKFVFSEKAAQNKDIQVAIPNDILGMDAFSVIIENIIRNCAKHGGKNHVTLVYHIENGDKIGLPEYYKISIHQNCDKTQECGHKNNCQDKVCNRRLDLNKPILDSNQALRSGAWGILEMKIAAAYLRKIPPEEIDNEVYRLEIDESGKWLNGHRNTRRLSIETPYLLTSDCCMKDDCLESKGLGYSFFLMKPKEVLIFDYIDSLNLGKKKEINLLNHGIRIIHKNEIIDSYKTGIFNHKILLCLYDSKNAQNRLDNFKIKEKNTEDDIEAQIDYSTNMPNRIIWLDPEQFKKENDNCEGQHECLLNSLKAGQTDCFIKKCWEIVADKVFKDITKIKLNAKAIAINDTHFWLKRNQWDESKNLWNKENFDKYICAKFPYNDGVAAHGLGLCERGEMKRKGTDYDYFDISTSFSYSKIPLGIDAMIETVTEEGSQSYETVSFIESIITRIGIIDERLQEFAIETRVKVPNDPDQEGIIIMKYFEAMNVFMPLKKARSQEPDKPKQYEPDVVHETDVLNIDLLEPDFKNERDSKIISVKDAIEKWVETFSPNLEYLIVHLGILEKMYSTNKEDLARKFIESFKIKCSNAKIIIISGRGKPHNLPDGVRFLNYSQVSLYISDNQSKYLLTDLCNSARKPLK